MVVLRYKHTTVIYKLVSRIENDNMTLSLLFGLNFGKFRPIFKNFSLRKYHDYTSQLIGGDVCYLELQERGGPFF